MDKEKIILGIDPGTTVMGFGVIQIQGKKMTLLQFGDVPFNQKDDHLIRLKQIQEHVLMIIDKYIPDELAIEAPFYGKNVQSMLKLGRAQGVCMAAALSRNIPVFEYSPKTIKQKITGSGNASKEQIAGILQKMFNIPNIPKNLDATDGLAAAVTHFYQGSSPINQELPVKRKGNTKNWNSFLDQNPDRVR